MEVYIDDMHVKSKKHPDHMKHLQENFELLRGHYMKLNPLKCAFGASSGKVLGFMVPLREIEANPVQIKAIMDSQAPTTRRGVPSTNWSSDASWAVSIPFYRPVEIMFYNPTGS